MNFITFLPNEPLTVSLESTQAYALREKGFFFETKDGSWLFLEPAATESLKMLNLQPGETFTVCQRITTNGRPYWDIWLTPETEQKRATKEIKEETGEDLTPLLVASIRQVEKRKRKAILPMPEPAAELPPTGTEGPRPIPVATGPAKPIRPDRLPYNVAFREVLRFVTEALKDAGEQWNDQAKQDLISTVIIAAVKQGHISLWERDAA